MSREPVFYTMYCDAPLGKKRRGLGESHDCQPSSGATVVDPDAALLLSSIALIIDQPGQPHGIALACNSTIATLKVDS